jgi:hypothetical protein
MKRKMISFFIFSSNGAPVEWNWQEKQKYSGKKTCPSATLSTINPTWTDPGIELGPPRWEAADSYYYILKQPYQMFGTCGLQWAKSFEFGPENFTGE